MRNMTAYFGFPAGMGEETPPSLQPVPFTGDGTAGTVGSMFNWPNETQVCGVSISETFASRTDVEGVPVQHHRRLTTLHGVYDASAVSDPNEHADE